MLKLLMLITISCLRVNGFCFENGSKHCTNVSLLETMVSKIPCSIQQSGGDRAAIQLCKSFINNCKLNEQDTKCCLANADCEKKEKVQYRSIDGSCNNLKVTSLGRPDTPHVRVAKASYEDNIHSARLSKNKSVLPSARLITTTIFTENNISDTFASYIVMSWGQIIAHDLSFTKGVATTINCCDRASNDPKQFDDVCMPISVPKDDSFFKKFNITCISMRRTNTTLFDNRCTKGPAYQFNLVTHFLDASMTYGSDEGFAKTLRASNGLLKSRKGGRFLPALQNPEESCPPGTKVCYIAGDFRVNQNLLLVVMQTLLLREHNRIARELGRLNPNWNDEKIYQESRKLVIAIYQHITYNEWLPMLISKKDLIARSIIFTEQNKVTQYNPEMNPSILTEFSATAFRIIHSAIQPTINLANDQGDTLKTFSFSPSLDDPSVIEEGNSFNELVNGLILQPMGKIDRFITKQITNLFDAGKVRPFGIDLIAIDIQRGRDQGIPSYNEIRNKLCGLPKAKSFSDLQSVMEKKDIHLLQSLYIDVNDIDLYVGGALETPEVDDRVGPTFKCIFMEQFHRLRYGDRYFYDNSLFQPGAFSPEQLREIKKLTLSALLCNNNMIPGGRVKLRSFELDNSKNPNPKVFCGSLPNLDLTVWQEKV